jgi:molybdate transport system substrate-binding protein
MNLRAVPGAATRSRLHRWLLALTCALTVGGLATACGQETSASDDPLLVGAASDLRPAFEALRPEFEEVAGRPVTLVFGSSGQLAQQILEGAPMDVFASADAAYVKQVLAAGRGDPGTRGTYAFGRVALWASTGAWGDWSSLADLAADPAVGSVAIANPDHAPYGRAAREALRAAGVWDDLEPRLVLGQNVADAHRLAATANADAAVTALSLALAADEDGEGRWLLLPEEAHAPLRQDAAVVTDDPGRATSAAELLEYLGGDEARATMRRFGFLLPGDEPPAAWER